MRPAAAPSGSKAGSPARETILARFDNWKSGPLPKVRRVIARDVPSAGTRRAMLERGDADISTGFPPKDFDQMIKEGKLKVVGVPIPNALWYVALNTSRPPFDNVKLRQAIAWAMPYEQIQSSAFFGRAKPMYGGAATVEQAGVAAAVPLHDRSRQGESADGGGRLRRRDSRRRSRSTSAPRPSASRRRC